MAPKTKIEKDAIIKKAFELTRQIGFENITARLLAAELCCSTQPIFYAFKTMDDLKQEVFQCAKDFFEEEMLQQPKDKNTPLFLNMGMKYIELAQKERNLFELLCMSGSVGPINSFKDLAGNASLTIDADVFAKTWIFAHGIACIMATNETNISEDEIKQILLEACTSFRKESR